MLVNLTTEYKDAVQVHSNEFANIIGEDLIHQPLEAGRCIAQPKGHDEKLKITVVKYENCLLDRFFFHCNLVVTRCKIKLHKNLGLENLASPKVSQCKVVETDSS